MRFDNAFLTSKGHVGIQVISNKETYTVYRDHENNIQASKGMSEEERKKAIHIFNVLEEKYLPVKYPEGDDLSAFTLEELGAPFLPQDIESLYFDGSC